LFKEKLGQRGQDEKWCRGGGVGECNERAIRGDPKKPWTSRRFSSMVDVNHRKGGKRKEKKKKEETNAARAG